MVSTIGTTGAPFIAPLNFSQHTEETIYRDVSRGSQIHETGSSRMMYTKRNRFGIHFEIERNMILVTVHIRCLIMKWTEFRMVHIQKKNNHCDYTSIKFERNPNYIYLCVIWSKFQYGGLLFWPTFACVLVWFCAIFMTTISSHNYWPVHEVWCSSLP